DDSRRKNSFRCRPSTEPSMVSLAPVSETSSMMQSRRHVPSMPIMCAANPRSNVTRSPLRRSVTDILRPQTNDTTRLGHGPQKDAGFCLRAEVGDMLAIRQLTTGKFRSRAAVREPDTTGAGPQARDGPMNALGRSRFAADGANNAACHRAG